MSEYPRSCVVIPDKSREKDSFGKGVIEERQTVAPEPTSAKKPTPVPISIPSAPIAVDSHLSTSSDPPPSYATHPGDDSVVSHALTPHLIPPASHHHCHPVPRRHPMRTRVYRRH